MRECVCVCERETEKETERNREMKRDIQNGKNKISFSKINFKTL